MAFLHVLAVECEVFLHLFRMPVAEDCKTIREGSTLMVPVHWGGCNCNNPVQQRALMTGWTEANSLL